MPSSSTFSKSVARLPPAAKKKVAPPSQSILSFFKKVPPPEESMFVASGTAGFDYVETDRIVNVDVGDTATAEMRYNEASEPLKRRRLSGREQPDISGGGAPAVETPRHSPVVTSRPPAPARGPFLDESDSEDGLEDNEAGLASGEAKDSPATAVQDGLQLSTMASTSPVFDHAASLKDILRPIKTTTVSDETAECEDGALFDGVYSEEDDGFEGEEYREQKFMKEQARLEAEAEAADESNAGACPSLAQDDSCNGDGSADAMETSCPICSCNLAGQTADQATIHVNACLDGRAGDGDSSLVPLITANPANRALQPLSASALASDDSRSPRHVAAPSGPKQPMTNLTARFARTAQPRPGQANPFGLRGSGESNGNSAFSKLMSGHAENAAWATAAAAESAARGRPAYERTCPFYKIMPGFFICVDAFRYGAVESCRAYFLSHFHSDHYVGLTSKWCHGPIYCSKVTGRLVKSQLGTAAKWIVELDWDTTVEVPDTQGVRVTMIPANHCPGSSLFLFEKDLGPRDGTSASKRTQRILHCGDFRACTAHVNHALIRPEMFGSLTTVLRGTHSCPKQQRIDICYLDTTYLNPRYAFPPQDDVIRACADLCAALDRSLRAGEEGVWDRVLRRRDRERSSDDNGSVRDFFVAAKRPEPDVVAESAMISPTMAPDAIRDSGTHKTALAVLGKPSRDRNRLLVICGTYSIGKERLCKAIAQALGTKIFASPAKIKIIAQLDDPELTALMTSRATEAQVHMQMLMEIRGETLVEYLATYQGHFSRVVGFRPSGWNYRPASNAFPVSGPAPSAGLAPGALAMTTLLHGAGWRTQFSVRDLVPQRGSTREALCFGVPYSEHSSFRELALFLMALHIEKVVPTVNVGSEASRRRMKGWIDRWLAERRRGGLVRLLPGDEQDTKGQAVHMWDGKTAGVGGVAYW